MTVRLSSSGKDVSRKLRAHRKSRQGCGNCKIRRVKVGRPPHFSILQRTSTEPRLQCDESKPRCNRCTAFGVFCNYDCKYSDLQPSVDGAFNIETLQRFPCSLSQTIPSMIAPPLRQQSMGSLESNALYQLGKQDLELLSKFQTRTVLTISTDKSLRIYQNEIIKLAFSVRTLSSCVVSHTDIDGSAPILNACVTVVDINA
jgi:hypothetical protein